MEERQKLHQKKPFVEPKLIKGAKLGKVTFQPAGYGDPPADPLGPFHSASPFHGLSHSRGHHK